MIAIILCKECNILLRLSCALSIILDCIWGSIFGDLYFFVTISLDPLKPGVVVPVRVTSMGQIEQFDHLLYLKVFNCVLTKD